MRRKRAIGTSIAIEGEVTNMYSTRVSCDARRALYTAVHPCCIHTSFSFPCSRYVCKVQCMCVVNLHTNSRTLASVHRARMRSTRVHASHPSASECVYKRLLYSYSCVCVCCARERSVKVTGCQQSTARARMHASARTCSAPTMRPLALALDYSAHREEICCHLATANTHSIIISNHTHKHIYN